MTQTLHHDEFWVFGYGSLIWRPGFEFIDRAPARLTGLHRALCVYSFVHRGTPEKPGLVLGLDRGGACRGMAYRVDIRRRDETIAYLREREQVTSVYLETWRQVMIATHPERTVRALMFCVDRGHVQYAGRLSLDQQVHLVRQGHGRSGNNRDYVLSTVDALEALGCRDRDLHLLAQRLRGTQEREVATPELTTL
jgi:cation transport protein ChaC